MIRTIGVTLLLLIGVVSSLAGGTPPVPEISGNSALAAVTLLSGGLLVLRARRKK